MDRQNVKGNPAKPAQEKIAELIASLQPALREGVTVAVVNTNDYGDQLVEIRCHGAFEWRGWSFEPDFSFELERCLRFYQR